LNELYLTIIGFNVQSREKFIVVSVVDELRVSDDDRFVCVLIILFQSLYAKLEIYDESRADLDLLTAVSKARSF
jgi:hypothetical protein